MTERDHYRPRAPTPDEVRAHLKRRGRGAAWMVYNPRAAGRRAVVKVLLSDHLKFSDGTVDYPFVVSDVGGDAAFDHSGARGWWWRPLNRRGNAEPWP